ncbi:hypothetical protein [Pontibacter sp. HSC-36F09]|uniref:hypothetical protein n=1 Tax=Pontibacter sp. HSC-36F09 TaxID=2910966 RepID=UPI00209F672F|nr:hypothetical protein [Pontibacter sp. HSC-36F09]MCP2042376.1 hypothetical protein [Pontibacter sp. HSC-36F09]
MHLNKEEKRFISRWARAKERGQWHYILTRGLLWGAMVSVFSYLFQSWDALKAWNTTVLADGFSSSDFLVRLLIYSTIGLGIYAYHWNFNTKRYNQLKNIERHSQAVTNTAKSYSEAAN